MSNITFPHRCKPPRSSDFRDGNAAAGCWTQQVGDVYHHFEQVVGQSGVYIIETDNLGNIVRDDRPWQMTV